MAESYLNDAHLSISAETETSLNTFPAINTSSFVGLPTTEAVVLLPTVDPYIRENRLGHELPSGMCKNYWKVPEFSVSDDIESLVCAKSIARGFGSPVSSGEVLDAVGAYDHGGEMKSVSSGRQLPSSSFLSLLDDINVMLAGCVVKKFRAEQKGAARATYKTDFCGTGKFLRDKFEDDVPETANIPCMSPTETVIKWTGPSGLVTITNTTRVREWFVELDNAIRTDRRTLGDPLLGGSAYLRSLRCGQRKVTAGLTLVQDGMVEWQNMESFDVLTNFTVTVKGPTITGSARHEVEFIIPRLMVGEIPPPSDDGGDAVIAIPFTVLEDPATKGGMTYRVRNNLAELV